MVTIKEKFLQMYWLSAVEELPVQRRWLLPGKVQTRFWFPRERLETAEIQL